MLSTKKLLYHIVEKVDEVQTTTKETLATNAFLYRRGNLRILHLNGYSGAQSTLAVPAADAPSATVNVPSLVGGATNDYRLGQVAIYNDTKYVQRYYVGTYHSAGAGLSSVASTDKTFATAVWTV